jgi:hypothetical protein
MSPAEHSYLRTIEKWLKDSGTPEWKLGVLAAANAKAVERIRTGTARIETLNAVLSYIRSHPPKKARRAVST